jgi:hypothetical protein
MLRALLPSLDTAARSGTLRALKARLVGATADQNFYDDAARRLAFN